MSLQVLQGSLTLQNFPLDLNLELLIPALNTSGYNMHRYVDCSIEKWQDVVSGKLQITLDCSQATQIATSKLLMCQAYLHAF